MKLRSVSKRCLGPFRGFTLAELIVVVAILAVLATVGFLALSGYSQEAKDSAAKTNVRSVYSSIVSESAISGNSPRYYVVHDQNFALTGTFAFIDGNPSALTWWDWNQSGTNYSAGNPDWTKLKLAKDKFRISSSEFFLSSLAAGSSDPAFPIVGAADFVTEWNDGKKRSRGFVQVAGLLPASKTAVVVGNFSKSQTGVAWLVLNPLSWSPDTALVDGWPGGTAPACSGGSAWDGNACSPIVNGVCGSAGGSASVGYPAANLCSSWNAVASDSSGSDGYYDWTCAWSAGGSSATCTASVSLAMNFSMNWYMAGNTNDTTAQRRIVWGRTDASGNLYLTDFVDSCCSYASWTRESLVCNAAEAKSANGCWFYAPSGWSYVYTNYGAYWRAKISGNTLTIWTCGLSACGTSWTAAGTAGWTLVGSVTGS